MSIGQLLSVKAMSQIHNVFSLRQGVMTTKWIPTRTHFQLTRVNDQVRVRSSGAATTSYLFWCLTTMHYRLAQLAIWLTTSTATLTSASAVLFQQKRHNMLIQVGQALDHVTVFFFLLVFGCQINFTLRDIENMFE